MTRRKHARRLTELEALPKRALSEFRKMSPVRAVEEVVPAEGATSGL